MTTETDIEIPPFDPIEGENIWPYHGGSRLFLQFSKTPSREWQALFSETVKERITKTDQTFVTARVAVEVVGAKTGVTCLVSEATGEQILQAAREATAATNHKANDGNAAALKMREIQQSQRTSEQESTKRVIEKLRGK